MADDKKRYMILIYGNGDGVKALPEAEQMAHMQKWGEWYDELKNTNKIAGGDPLMPEAKTIRGVGMVVGDGYLVANKDEAIGGYMIVYADSMDEAVELAKGCPTYELDGNVEIREIMVI